MRAAACVTTEKCRQFFMAGTGGADLTLSHQKLLIMLDNERFYSTILSLKVGDETQAAILKDVQRHPFKNAIVHVDFQRVEENEKIRISIPLHFTGAAVSPGVKSQGGLVSHMRTEVEISCLPKDLPEFIEVDISGLSLNESIHLSQLRFRRAWSWWNWPRKTRRWWRFTPACRRARADAAAAVAGAPAAEGAAAAAPAAGAAAAGAPAADAAKKAEPAKKEEAKKEPAKKDAKK